MAYSLAHLGDSHCHLSVEINRSRADSLVDTLEDYDVHERFFKLMSTNHIDIEIIDYILQKLKNPVIQGYFGIHPWYSHLFTNGETDKVKHYNEVLSPAPDNELLDILPHPININEHLNQITELCKRYPGSGIGELGLDKMFRIPSNGYYGNQEIQEDIKLTNCRVKMDHQMMVFTKQLELAQKLERPISVHCVKAHGPLYDTIKQYDIPLIILHSFSGSVDQAKRWVKDYTKRNQKLKFSFSNYINGVEEKREAFKQLIDILHDDQILIETDMSLDKHLNNDYEKHLFGISETVRQLRGWDINDFENIIQTNTY